MRLDFFEEGPNNHNYYREKGKSILNLIALTLVCFSIGGMGGWHAILTVALWTNDPTYNMQL